MVYQPFNLKGKKALVTGGNGGIGLGMAKALAEAGADVAIWGRNSDKNKQAVEVLEAIGVTAFAAEVDVADERAVSEVMAETVSRLGGIDCVIANAGLSVPSRSMFDISEADYRKVLGVNLDGVMYTFREAARHMIEQKSGGSMVVVSSLGALEGMPAAQHYSASKGAVISVMRSCAVEFARHKIRTNAVLPGFISTDMTENMHNEVFDTKVMPRIPARRWGEPDDFGGIAVYLASDASAYQTGSTITIDGGYSIF